MKIVILESYAIAENDLDWGRLKSLADEVIQYPRTEHKDIVQRLQGAQIAVCNKCNIDEEILEQLPLLRFVALTATGTDSLDIAACRKHNVAVANVPSYSTYSVAQLTLALLLEICQCPSRHEKAMRAGYWQLNVPREYNITSQIELQGKTFGIIGYGDIGKRMALLCEALGMNILINTRTAPKNDKRFVTQDELFNKSDVISLHCPLTDATRNIINEHSLNKMKSTAILLNSARGALVDEQAVANALEKGKLAAYGADAYKKEPILANNPLLTAPNAFLTPHIGWATQEALKRLYETVEDNIEAYLKGEKKNIVN